MQINIFVYKYQIKNLQNEDQLRFRILLLGVYGDHDNLIDHSVLPPDQKYGVRIRG